MENVTLGNSIIPGPAQQIEVSLCNLIAKHYSSMRPARLGFASAILMHFCRNEEELDSQSFTIANSVHFVHSFAFLFVPLAHNPVFTGVLMTTGTVLFSGCMYYRAFTGQKRLQCIVNIGSFCLFGAWLSLVF